MNLQETPINNFRAFKRTSWGARLQNKVLRRHDQLKISSRTGTSKYIYCGCPNGSPNNTNCSTQHAEDTLQYGVSYLIIACDENLAVSCAPLAGNRQLPEHLLTHTSLLCRGFTLTSVKDPSRESLHLTAVLLSILLLSQNGVPGSRLEARRRRRASKSSTRLEQQSVHPFPRRVGSVMVSHQTAFNSYSSGTNRVHTRQRLFSA